MVTLHETNSAARELQLSETRLRALVKRGVIEPTARTTNGAMLFDTADLARAKEKLKVELKQ